MVESVNTECANSRFKACKFLQRMVEMTGYATVHVVILVALNMCTLDTVRVELLALPETPMKTTTTTDRLGQRSCGYRGWDLCLLGEPECTFQLSVTVVR
jgi:hypothetical protein